MQKLVAAETPAKRFLSCFFFPAFLGTFILCSSPAKAQGGLLIFPKRVVFENSKRSQTINLANTGNDTVRYLVSIVQARMNVNGSFETISQPDSGQYFADQYVRFFPRNVVLGPNESQTIKIQLVNSGGLQPGEYRSHIYFRAEPTKKPLGEEEPVKDTTSISVQLVAIFGISIPLIIRVGESTSAVTIPDASFAWQKDTVPTVKVTFNRTGNMSVYGDITVDHISQQGKVTRIGKAMGMAIYTPNASRNFILLLDNTAGVDYHKGRLRVAYTTQPDARSVQMAEKDIQLKL